jgi:hypothetical protein
MRAFSLAALLLVTTLPAVAAPVDDEVGRRLEMLRAVKTGQSREVTEKYNVQMDEAWKYFEANKAAVLPVLRRTLAAEIHAKDPSQLVLLDIGHFLYEEGAASDAALARDALFRLDPASEIVRWNDHELFFFAHRAARDHDARVLPLIDAAFLRRDQVSIPVPQHAMSLNATLASAFLYGVYGADAEPAVRAALADSATALRAMEVLAWVGSPDSVAAVGQAMRKRNDYDSFVRGVAFMMSTGGPKGREFLLGVDPAALDPKSREYFNEVRGKIASVGYEEMKASFAGLPGETRLSPQEVRARLSAMIANAGKDDRTSPQAILDADLPPAFLIAELLRVRKATFQRVSNEALTDAQINNALLTALRYKEKQAP